MRLHVIAIAVALATACGGSTDDPPPPTTVDTLGARDSVAADAPADTATAVAPSDTGPPRAAGAPTVIGERAVGNVSIGMPEAELRASADAERDTTWWAEGVEERGVVVPFGPSAATALLSKGVVARIHIRDRGLRTEAGLGVGSTLGALRAAYGRACTATSEGGRSVVWFAGFRGVSFALDQRPGARANAIQSDPSLLPDSAVVEELWVHGSFVPCRAPD